MIELKDFTSMIKLTAEGVRKYAPDFSKPETLHVWYGALKHLELDRFKETCQMIISTFEEFPSIAKILSLSKGAVLDPTEIAQETIVKIEKAVRGFGYMRVKDAEDFIGPFGWGLVQRIGGWPRVCDVETDKDLTFLLKDIKESAIIELKQQATQGAKERIEQKRGNLTLEGGA